MTDEHDPAALAKAIVDANLYMVLETFSHRSLAHGGHEWKLEDVQASARLRLYRAIATEQYVLGADDRRVPVTM